MAQTVATGTISGVVTDSSGAAISGATVTIKNSDTGFLRTLTTTSDGSFTVPFLQSGHYEVIAAATNFGTLDHKSLTLTVGQVLTVNSALAAASVSTEVVVTSESPLLDTQKTETSQTITQSYVTNLPVNGRRWDNFVLLTPNVAPDGTSGLVSYRGISGLYNANLIDGVSNQQALFNEARGRSTGAPYVFSQDSIKEFESSVSGYSAQFGQAAGGQVNAITKSGTNAIHGDLFYYLRYPSLNALDPYSKWQARYNNGGNATLKAALLTQLTHQQHQFGGSIGGPVIKDKLFYFFTYDGFRKVTPIQYVSSTSGSTLLGFAAATATCPAPLTFDECGSAAKFLVSETTGTFPRNIKQDIFFPKLDYQLNGKNHLSVSFLWQNFHEPNGYSSGPVVTNGGIQQNANSDFHERFLVAAWDSVLSSSTANSLRFQWSRDLETNYTTAPGPSVTLGSGLIGSYGESLAVPRYAEPDEHRWQIFDVISRTQGKHSLKAGVDLNFIHEIMINLFQGNANYTYNLTGSTAATDFAAWVQDVYGVNGGQHYSAFTQAIDPITGNGTDNFWTKNLAGFAEDTWKALPSLTFNIGLRYDLQLVPQPTHPYTVRADGTPTAIGAAFTSKIPINYRMFQPRVGFAYNPFPGTVLRGSYGMFYGLVPMSTYYNVRVENGYYQRVYSYSPTSGVYPTGAPASMATLSAPTGPPVSSPFTCTTGNGGGGCLIQPATPGVDAAGLAGAPPLAPHGMSPNFTQPYTHSWDLSVEQVLPFKTTLSIGYVGTRGMRLPYSIDVNQPTYTGATRTYQEVSSTGAPVGSPVTVPYYPCPGASPLTNCASQRPTPDTGFSVVYAGLNTWYNSMAVSLKTQSLHGFQGLFNYTWAHTSDLGQTSGGASAANSGGGAFFGTDVILDPFNIKEKYANPAINMTREAARSDLDMRGRFIGSLVYTSKTHFGHYVDYAASGWTLAGTYTAQTGVPETKFVTNSPGACTIAVCAGGASLAPMDGGATGGADNTNNTVGSVTARAPQTKRNGFPGPGVHNLDMRISRDFGIYHDVKLQFLAEAFNLVNHRNGLGISTSAYTFANPGATGCPASSLYTCLVPNTSATPFGTINNTSGTLYGARQLQVAAKLFF
ncbi:MAG TPA: carboxypeptidase regulatory-like domain-containing protein [Acidobacteriaceae bacterium]